MNIRLCTVVIIKRGAEFLVGRIPYTAELRWSRSPYDAWKTRRKEAAQAVAHIVGGDLWLFNPIAGQLREIREEGGSDADGAKQIPGRMDKHRGGEKGKHWMGV